MFDQGSKTELADAACGPEMSLNEWFCCWDTVEALARDASRLHEKCGTNCSAEDLRQWRELVFTQLEAVLAEERRIFAEISRTGELTPGAGLSTAA
jgi:hypothetical protein